MDRQPVLGYQMDHHMPQFPISNEPRPGEHVSLSRRDSHHLKNVFRGKEGEKIKLVSPRGVRFEGRIENISSQGVSIVVERELPRHRTNGRLTLGQALLKKDKMEFVIQKAAELGVAILIPYASARTVVRLKKNEKLTRWQKIAEETAKQCERDTQMAVEAAASFGSMVKNAQADVKMLFWEEGGKEAKPFLQKLKKEEAASKTFIAVIGPEGGFPREEVEQAVDAGFTILSLGPRVLRAETAAIVAATLIQYELENI